MEVQLMQYTSGAEELCAAAYRSCHDTRSGWRIQHDIGELEHVEKRIANAKRVGHHSTLEHAVFTFSISDVSRALTHQLVRHRIASYSQQSQRYVEMDEQRYVMPPSIRDDDRASFIFGKSMNQIWDCYNQLISHGVKPEDARFVLPNACTTNIVVTMNARSLLNFFELRIHPAAQWEIRELAVRMKKLAKKVAPAIFGD